MLSRGSFDTIWYNIETSSFIRVLSHSGKQESPLSVDSAERTQRWGSSSHRAYYLNRYKKHHYFSIIKTKHRHLNHNTMLKYYWLHLESMKYNALLTSTNNYNTLRKSHKQKALIVTGQRKSYKTVVINMLTFYPRRNCLNGNFKQTSPSETRSYFQIRI